MSGNLIPIRIKSGCSSRARSSACKPSGVPILRSRVPLESASIASNLSGCPRRSEFGYALHFADALELAFFRLRAGIRKRSWESAQKSYQKNPTKMLIFNYRGFQETTLTYQDFRHSRRREF